MTASNRLNFNTDLNSEVGTRGNLAVEAGELSVYEKNLDWQTHTHHNKFFGVLGFRFWDFCVLVKIVINLPALISPGQPKAQQSITSYWSFLYFRDSILVVFKKYKATVIVGIFFP